MSRISRSLRTVAVLSTLGGALAGCPDAAQEAADFNPCSASRAIDTCQRDADDYAGSWPEMDAFLADMMQRRGYAGCGIGLMVDDRIVYLGAQGWANLPGTSGDLDADSFDGAEPFGLHTMALTASVTKTVVAAAVLDAIGHALPGDAEDLAGSLNQTVADLLPLSDPDNPGLLGPVTLHDLLSHNSGIASSTAWEPTMNSDAELQALFPELAHPGMHPRVAWYAMRDRTMHSVNPTTDYENFNYRILGSMLDFHTISDPDEVGWSADDLLDWSQDKAGHDWLGGFEVHLRENMAEAHPDLPLDTMCMRTPWRVGDLDHDGIAARGYTYSDDDTDGIWDTYVEAGLSNSNGLNGASGSLMMTVGDLTRVMLGLSDGTLVDADTLALMTTAYGTDTALNSTLGYGVHLPTQTFTSDGTSWPAWQAAGSKGFDDFGAGFRVVDVGGRTIGAAVMCNGWMTLGPQNTELSSMLDIVYDTYIVPGLAAEDGPPSADPAAGRCPDVQLTAAEALEAQWATTLHQRFKSLLHQNRGDLDATERAVRRQLLEQRGGRDVLAAYDRGDIQRAALLLGDMLTLTALDPAGAPTR